MPNYRICLERIINKIDPFNIFFYIFKDGTIYLITDNFDSVYSILSDLETKCVIYVVSKHIVDRYDYNIYHIIPVQGKFIKILDGSFNIVLDEAMKQSSSKYFIKKIIGDGNE